MSEMVAWAPSPNVADFQGRAVERLGEWAQSATAAYQIAEKLVESSFVPAQFKGKPVEAAAAILAGVEVGLQPMASLRSFDIIQGQAAARALTLRAIVQSHGHEIQQVEATSSRCVMRGRRRGAQDWQTVTWTIDRAQSLGLTGKDNWKKQPQAMLMARATSELARLIAADAILGIGYSVEEIEDGASDAAPATPAPAPAARKRTLTRKPADATPETDDAEPSEAQVKKMHALFGERGLTDRDAYIAFASDVAGRELGSTSELSRAEMARVIDALEGAPVEGVPDEDPGEPVDAVVLVTAKQKSAINAQIRRLGLGKDEYLLAASTAAGREIAATADLTSDEADELLRGLALLPDASQPGAEAAKQAVRDALGGSDVLDVDGAES